MGKVNTDDLHFWVQKMMKSLEINDYHVDIGGSTIKGDGYVGEITFLTVSTNENATKKNYDLVIKSAKKSEELRRQTPVKEAYDREIHFYSKVLPILNEFQSQKAVEKPFDKIPKCYSVFNDDLKEAVILQNLRTQGYDLHDRKKPMNLDHVLMVVTQYGRFHGLTLALKHKKPSIFKSITKNMTDVFGKFIVKGQMIEVFYKEFNNIKRLLEEGKQFEALKKYDGFEKEFEKILMNFTDENTTPSVLIHGDCWNNNFMFKYEGADNTKPTDMRFLDFQLTRVGSPVIDLSYFLYSCADKQVLKDFDFILQAYHNSLSDFLSEFGCDAETMVPFKKLKEQWRQFGKYGLVVSLFLLKITLCDSTEAPDLLETAEKGENFGESFHIKMQDEDIYSSRIKDVFLHFAEKFL